MFSSSTFCFKNEEMPSYIMPSISRQQKLYKKTKQDPLIFDPDLIIPNEEVGRGAVEIFGMLEVKFSVQLAAVILDPK